MRCERTTNGEAPTVSPDRLPHEPVDPGRLLELESVSEGAGCRPGAPVRVGDTARTAQLGTSRQCVRQHARPHAVRAHRPRARRTNSFRRGLRRRRGAVVCGKEGFTVSHSLGDLRVPMRPTPSAAGAGGNPGDAHLFVFTAEKVFVVLVGWCGPASPRGPTRLFV